MTIDVWWIRVGPVESRPRDRVARASARRAAVLILKEATGIDPLDPRTGAPRWETGLHGKPGPLADYHWNLTHGRGWAAVAIADRPVGIDLVHDESLIRPEAVCARYFAPREAAGLDRSGIAAALARKEALAKALGARLLDLLATDVTADTIMSADLGESAIPQPRTQPDIDSSAVRRPEPPAAGRPAMPADAGAAHRPHLPARSGYAAAFADVSGGPSPVGPQVAVRLAASSEANSDPPLVPFPGLPVAGKSSVPSASGTASVLVRLTDLPAPPGHTAALAAVASSPSAQFHLRQHVWRSTCDSPQPRPPRSAGRRAVSTPS